MLKKLSFFLLLIIAPVLTKGQSSFDSLKQIYTAQYVFEQREKGSADKYIKNVLTEINNPEIRQLTACAIAENLHGYGNWVNNKYLLRIVEDVIAEPQTERARAIAEKVKAEILRSLIGTKIIPIALPNSKGDTLQLSDYLAKKEFIVVDLWATWCGPCIAEMKKFNALKQQYSSLEFYSISLDENFDRVKKFTSRNKEYTWPIVWAGKGSPLWSYFKARLIPSFVIVDTNGIIVSHVVGKGLEEELKKLYKK